MIPHAATPSRISRPPILPRIDTTRNHYSNSLERLTSTAESSSSSSSYPYQTDVEDEPSGSTTNVYSDISKIKNSILADVEVLEKEIQILL